MKKRKARLRGTKTAGKFEQKKLIERMNAILENPRLVLPKTNKNVHFETQMLNVLCQL